MKHILFTITLFIVSSLASFAQNFEIECTPVSASVSVKYDNNMNPIVIGTVSNSSGCVWNGDKVIYKGNGKTIEGVDVHMSYSNNKGMRKVAQVNIAPNNKGSFSISFPRVAEGCKAYAYSVQGVRFSDGTYYRFGMPYNGYVQ